MTLVRKWPVVLGLTALTFASSVQAEAGLKVGETLSGFCVKSVTELPDVSVRMWRMTYEKNGAELVWLECPDENRTFTVFFKTIPSDDTGVAHIMEHSVLCGSEKYPVKEPFVELLKSSFATFINAWTSSDCTSYPIATKNPKDFLNLVDVYLDAVFRPLSVKDDWAMRQEGWHYEYDGTNLTRNGIVYSEMKGAFGDPETVADLELRRQLFPDNTYGRESGGDPVHVPELTYEAYRAFYARFYHPSNARFFLYGHVDLKPTLALIDTYLKPYERRASDVTVPRQKPVAGKKTLPYECAEKGDRTLLCDGWVSGTFDERERNVALGILCDLLTGSNESPVKKALLSEDLCEDVNLYYGGYEQKALFLLVKNTSPGKAETCRRTVRETVERLCREGLDIRRLAALIDREEFSWREMDTDQRGLQLFGRVRSSWLYGGDPALNLSASGLFRRLRERIGTGWYEQILRQAVLENPHHAEVTLLPSATLASERRRQEREELAKIKAGMSAEELARIATAAKELKERQSAPDRPEDVAKLPRLSLSDIPLKGAVPQMSVGTIDGVTVVRPQVSVSGIAYLDFYIPLKDPEPSKGLMDYELLDVPFLASVFGNLPTEHYTEQELQNELDGKLGAFEVFPASREKGPYLAVRLSALASRKDEMLRLAEEVLLRTRFDDAAAIGRLRAQRREQLEREARSYGRNMVQFRAKRLLSRRCHNTELFAGLEQLQRLRGDIRGEDLARLARLIFTGAAQKGLTIVATGELTDEDVRRAIALWPRGERELRAIPRRPLALGDEGFVADGVVGYAATASRLPADVPFSGSQLVAAKIVSLEHLWNEIRVKGGAYGGNLTVSPDGEVVYASWRDPNPANSLVQFRRSGEALRAFVASGASLANYQVAVAKTTEPNLSPRAEALFVGSQYLNGRDPEMLQKLRREILATKPADMLSFAQTLSSLTNSFFTTTAVFANEKLLQPCGLKRTIQ